MSNRQKRFGQILYGARQIIVRFWKRIYTVKDALAFLGQELTEVDPINDQYSEVKQYTVPDLSTYFKKYTVPGNIDGMPNILTAFGIVYSNGGSDADFTETANLTASGTAWSVGASVSGTAQASAFSIPKIAYTIYTPPSTNVPIINCFFYTDDLGVANILSILTANLGASVTAWPIFKPQPRSFVLLGQRVAASGRRDYQGSASVSPSGTTTMQSDGVGTQYDLSPSAEQAELPPTLHATLIFTANDTSSKTGTTTVTVNGGVISGGGTSTVTAAAASFVAGTCPATSPTNIPSSGLSLYRYDPGESTFFSHFFVHAQVFDWSTIA